jgi:hypothetical protein
MKRNKKLMVAVSVGTIVIELALLAGLWFVFVGALPFLKVIYEPLAQGEVGINEQGLLVVSVLATLALLFWAYHRVSDYLRTRLCWALVHHFHGRG